MISYSNLDENSNRIIQPISLKVELMQHQKTAVFAMKDLESKGYVDVSFRYYSNELKDLRIESNIGILGDKVGSGKTLIITSLILESPKPVIRPTFYSSDRYTTIQEIIKTSTNTSTNTSAINVIMVPKTIQHQWEDVFNNQVVDGSFNMISHVDVTTKTQLTLIDNVPISEPDKPCILLCNDKTIHDVIDRFNYKWARFIIDEADTIQFTLMNKINASFIWLVTGTTNGVPCSNKKYIREIFGKNITWQPDFLTVKNKIEYIDTSLNLPKPNRITIKCKTPYEVTVLAQHIPTHIMNMINAGNSDIAIRTLNCHVDTTDNIFKVISKNYMMAIKNKEIELAAENKKIYTSPEKTREHAKRIKRLEAVILRLKYKLESMKRSLLDSHNDEMCPICMDDFNKPTMVDCCYHKYCFDCLTITLNSTQGRCPVCRTQISKDRMHIVKDEDEDAESEAKDETTINIREKRDKLEELYTLITSKRDGRFLVFADYDETFQKIEKVLKQHKTKYGILKGASAKIKSTLKDFRDGKINVIMLNAKNFGAGMNLQCATDIVMYHRFTNEMEEQIIGRGQRLGRQDVLNVYYLIHDNEDTSYKCDNFNDITHQEWIELDQDLNLNLNPDDDVPLPQTLVVNKNKKVPKSRSRKIVKDV